MRGKEEARVFTSRELPVCLCAEAGEKEKEQGGNLLVCSLESGAAKEDNKPQTAGACSRFLFRFDVFMFENFSFVWFGLLTLQRDCFVSRA